MQYQRGGYAGSVLAEEAVEHRRGVYARQRGEQACIVALTLVEARDIHLRHRHLHMRRSGVYFEQGEMIVIHSRIIGKLRRHGYRLGIAAQVENILYPVFAEELHIIRRGRARSAAAQQSAVFREAAALYRISAEVAAVLYVFKRHMSEAFHSQSSS